jgi:hypothetical protein
MRAATTLLLALAACAPLPEPETVARAVLPDVPTHVAGPGQIMVVGPGPGVEAAQPGHSALVYVGMRNRSEAVFERRILPAMPGPVRETGVPGVFVPVQQASAASPGFLPPRGAGGEALSEIVLQPALGATFGVDDVMITVTEITPAQVRYQVTTF